MSDTIIIMKQIPNVIIFFILDIGAPPDPPNPLPGIFSGLRPFCSVFVQPKFINSL